MQLIDAHLERETAGERERNKRIKRDTGKRNISIKRNMERKRKQAAGKRDEQRDTESTSEEHRKPLVLRALAVVLDTELQYAIQTCQSRALVAYCTSAVSTVTFSVLQLCT